VSAPNSKSSCFDVMVQAAGRRARGGSPAHSANNDRGYNRIRRCLQDRKRRIGKATVRITMLITSLLPSQKTDDFVKFTHHPTLPTGSLVTTCS
jgi:hypothetical protein